MFRLFVRTIVCACFVPMAVPSAEAQVSRPAGRLLVTVVDETGGVLPAATVTVAGQDDATRAPVVPVTASAQGVATFEALAPGRYTLQAEFPGFELATVRNVRVRAGENTHRVTLRVKTIDEELTIRQDGATAALDPMGLMFANVLTRELIEALPDDPEEMAAVLEAMAPPGAKFRIDGFTGGTLPPKSMIKSVRIPKADAMAAQNHVGGHEGALFIDIRTQPGEGPMRGSVDTSFFDDALMAKNPFVPVKGAEQNRGGNAFLAGTIVPNRSSFSLNVGGASQYTSPNVLAVLPDGTTLAESVTRPSRNRTFGLRMDHALSRDRALRVSLDGRSGRSGNLGVGGFNLPERGHRSRTSQYILRVAEAGPLGRRMYSESRLQLTWSSSRNEADVEAPAIRVIDAFTSGGAQMKGGQRSFTLEAAGDLDYVRGLHSWRFGALIEGGRFESDDTTNYLGTYVFSSLAAFNAGQPSAYTRRIGDPNLTYSTWQAAVYAQDDWRVARNVLVSYGVRAGVLTLTDDRLNLSPRVTASWAPFGDQRLTVRASYGYLYDWIEGGIYKQALLIDGFRLQEINVTKPSWPVPPAAGSARATNRYLWSDRLPLATGHRLNVGADRQVTASSRVSVVYTLARSAGILRGRNLNAPVNSVRPDPLFANVVELVPDAEARSHALNVGWNLTKLDWKRTVLNVNYNWQQGEANSTGPFALPANGDDLDTEWGPSRPTHTVNVSLAFQPVQRLNVSVNSAASSGAPYNVTTGRDNNLDGVFNDRPAGVSRNSERGTARWDVGGRVSYAWVFGPPAPGRAANIPRFRVDAFVQFTNLLNRRNYVGWSGVMTSPLFGQPTNVSGMRRAVVGMKFSF